jgi:hypothetical protein
MKREEFENALDPTVIRLPTIITEVSTGGSGDGFINLMLGITVTIFVMFGIYFAVGSPKIGNVSMRWTDLNKYWVIGTFTILAGIIVLLSLYKADIFSL